MKTHLSAFFLSLWLHFCSQRRGEVVQLQGGAEQAHAPSEGLCTVLWHPQWRRDRLPQEGVLPAAGQPHRGSGARRCQWVLSFLSGGYVENLNLHRHCISLNLNLNLRHSAIASILLETRLGCLEKEIPRGTQEFINSISKMFSYNFIVTLMPKWSRSLLPYWGHYIAGWDGIFNFGEWLTFKMKKKYIFIFYLYYLFYFCTSLSYKLDWQEDGGPSAAFGRQPGCGGSIPGLPPLKHSDEHERCVWQRLWAPVSRSGHGKKKSLAFTLISVCISLSFSLSVLT